MRYNKITTCDICNGTGIGVVLWCQGCDCHCEGCHNPETWDFNQGCTFDVYSLDELCAELEKPYISRLTLSGGHPLAPENIEECYTLCYYVKKHYPQIKIWVYTGYVYENIKDLDIMKYIDTLVDGPYIQERKDLTLPFRGSSNQRIIDVQQSREKGEVILYEI